MNNFPNTRRRVRFRVVCPHGATGAPSITHPFATCQCSAFHFKLAVLLHQHPAIRRFVLSPQSQTTPVTFLCNTDIGARLPSLTPPYTTRDQAAREPPGTFRVHLPSTTGEPRGHRQSTACDRDNTTTEPRGSRRYDRRTH